MTPTEQDKELRSLISDVMADLMVDVSLKKLLKNDGNILEKGRQYIKSHNSRLNLIMQLITAYTDQQVREARKDELGKLMNTTRINGDQVINQATYSMIFDRIAELTKGDTLIKIEMNPNLADDEIVAVHDDGRREAFKLTKGNQT